MAQIRQEIYDQNELVKVKFIEVKDKLTTEEIIAKKE